MRATQGRPLFAAHADLAWPDPPHLLLWHAQTLLREFRGDGHVALLCAEGLGAIDALVIHAATGEVPAGILQQTRGWPDGAWAAAVDRMRTRGFVEGDEPLRLTDAGVPTGNTSRTAPTRSALPAYEALGEDACERLRALARPFSKAISDGGLLRAR